MHPLPPLKDSITKEQDILSNHHSVRLLFTFSLFSILLHVICSDYKLGVVRNLTLCVFRHCRWYISELFSTDAENLKKSVTKPFHSRQSFPQVESRWVKPRIKLIFMQAINYPPIGKAITLILSVTTLEQNVALYSFSKRTQLNKAKKLQGVVCVEVCHHQRTSLFL